MSVIDVPAESPDKYRNSLATIHVDGRRKFIHPTKPKGRYYTARSIVSVLLLVFLFGAPFVRVNGHPFMLFNIIERKFVLFGVVFFPQDFWILVLAMLTCLVSIVLFTAIVGRIWCGWLCPQTIFLEMLFRKIEYWIDGSSAEQRRLSAEPWSATKIRKRALKWGIFYALSFVIGNTFLAYVIGTDQLWEIVSAPPSDHPVGFGVIAAFSFVFFMVFTRFREQACVVVCPYGRYMSSLVDVNTIAITYDFKRGEPRGRMTREDKAFAKSGGNRDRGDCIDCYQCVDVCPTGIDIRDGIQLECVNCTACIDACDSVMKKIKKPRGLIRYASFQSVSDGHGRIFSLRVLSYLAVWMIVTSAFLYFFITRPMVEILVLRQAGTIAQTTANGDIANLYVLQVINKNSHPVTVELKSSSPRNAILTMLGEFKSASALSENQSRFLVQLPRSSVTGPNLDVTIQVLIDGRLSTEVHSRFLSIQ